MAIQIGCGSWSDAEYRNILYPPGLPATSRLSGYAQWFGHVEVNAGFYTIPSAASVAKWDEQTPPGFIFDFKLHKTLSGHGTRIFDLPMALRPPGSSPGQPIPRDGGLQAEIVAYTLEQLRPLQEKGKLGTFLLLLAPAFIPDKRKLEELDPIIEALRPHVLSVELRQRAWVQGSVLASTLAYFRERGVAWVAVDMPRIDAKNAMPAIDEVTNPDLSYLRLHGRNAEGYLRGKTAANRFHYDYSPAELEEIGGRIRKLADQARNVRVVASNHSEDFAPKAALALMKMLGQKVPEMETVKENLMAQGLIKRKD